MKIVFHDVLDPLHSHDGGMLGFEGLSLWPPNLGLLRDSRSGAARAQLKMTLCAMQEAPLTSAVKRLEKAIVGRLV